MQRIPDLFTLIQINRILVHFCLYIYLNVIQVISGWKIVALYLFYVQLKPEHMPSSKSTLRQNKEYFIISNKISFLL